MPFGCHASGNVIHVRKPCYVSGRPPVTIRANTRLGSRSVRATGYVLSGVSVEVTPKGDVPGKTSTSTVTVRKKWPCGPDDRCRRVNIRPCVHPGVQIVRVKAGIGQSILPRGSISGCQ